MMKYSLTLIFLFRCVFLQVAPEIDRNIEVPQSSYVPPVELKGLKSVLLYLYIEPHIPNSSEIEQRLERFAAEKLKSMGLTVDNSQPTMFSIEVELCPVELDECSKFTIIIVQVKVIDEVRLLRKASVKKPVDAVIWEDYDVGLLSREDFEKYIFEKVERQIELFRTDRDLAEGKH
jgi:hypothetical protein